MIADRGTFIRDIAGWTRVRRRIDARFYKPGTAGLPTAPSVGRSGAYAYSRQLPGRAWVPAPAMPGGSFGSYGRWLAHSKWFNQFRPRNVAKAAFPQLVNAGLVEAWDYWVGGIPSGRTWALPPGWRLVCDESNFMPLYPAGTSGYGVCNAAGIWIESGCTWFDPPAGHPQFGIAAVETGPPPFGAGVVVSMIQQTVPHPLASPEPFFARVSLNAPSGSPLTPHPVPGVTIVPDDRWPEDMQPQLAPVVPGSTGVPLPIAVAAVAARAGGAPRTDAPGTTPGPVVVPPVVPGVDTQPAPWTVDPPGVRPPFPRGKPPRGTRERKWLAKGPLAAALKYAGWATEAVDFVDAAWWALSNDSRKEAFKFFGHRPNPVERAAWVATHPDDVDWAKFLQNQASNQAGDRAGGRYGDALKKWHKANWGHGIDTRGRGPLETYKRIGYRG